MKIITSKFQLFRHWNRRIIAIHIGSFLIHNFNPCTCDQIKKNANENGHLEHLHAKLVVVIDLKITNHPAKPQQPRQLKQC